MGRDRRRLEVEMGSTSVAAMPMAECLLDAQSTQLTILTSLPASVHQRNPINAIQDRDVRYISILADKKDIEARFKLVENEVLAVPPVGLLEGGESETSTAPTKRRRKSECPSRPQKRTVNKNLTRPSDLPDVSFTSPVSLPYEKGEVMGSASPKVLPVNPSNSTIPSHPISPHHADAQATQSSTMQSSFSSSRLSTSVPRTSVVSVNCQSCVDPVELTTLWTTFPVGSGATAPASFASSTCSPTCRERAMEIKAVSPGPHRPASPSLFPSTEIYNVDPLDDHSAFPKISSNGDGMQQLLAAVRQGLTGSLLPEKSCSSSAYHSPGRVVSPSGGDCASPSGLVSSPVRLPSIGEFFHPTSPQTRITSPHHFEYIVDKLPVSPPLLSCQDGTRNNSKAGLINTSKAASSVPLDVHIPTISSEGMDRKRRSCSMDAAAILASVSIIRPPLVLSVIVPPLPSVQMKPLLYTGSSASSSAPGPKLNSSSAYTDMPDALPIRTCVSPFQNAVVSSPESFDATKADFESAVASIPPPLSVTIDEQRQSIRLRIKASVWNASSAGTAKGLTAHKEIGQATRRKTTQSDKISPIRVKKKWGKKSFPLEMKTVSHGKTKALNCMLRKPVTEQPRRRGRPPLSSLADRSDVMKLALTPGLSKISCKDLLVDFTTTSSPLSVARFELLDMRKKFEQMPAAVQYEIMRLLPKSWTVVGEDGQVSLKPGALGKVDSKFRHHLATWQSNLAAGEYDTEVRRKFIDMAVGNLDPWKMENFEPVYGQIMAGCWTNPSTIASTSKASHR